MLRIAMIGCGAIGTGLIDLLKNEPDIRLDTIVVHRERLATARQVVASLGSTARVTSRLDNHASKPDLLIECAGHQAIEEHVVAALERGIACLVVSVGALSLPGLAMRLEAAARAGKTQVQLLPGAIGAIDALSAARLGGLDHVAYTARKPALAWKNTPAEDRVDLDALTTATVIFEGSAREAVQLYPKNANVAATLSLAGLGFERTMVCLLADPAAGVNVHHVKAAGAFGELELTMRGQPMAANPKTSALTLWSVARALRNRTHALCI